MSTIASPRDPSTPLRRLSHNPHQPGTPTSSSRPSLDAPRSATASPSLGGAPFPGAGPAGPSSSAGAASSSKRANRAALREYYNLKKQQQQAAAAAGGHPGSGPGTPVLEVTTDPLEPPPLLPHHYYSEIPASELDAPDFDPDAYVRRALADSGLEELLRVYTRVLGELRALDAEKKALVYDNYSKLISATETIRKMRANMDPLNPMASTLDPAIAQIYSQASSLRESLRASVPAPGSAAAAAAEKDAARRRTRQLAAEVLATPERLRRLVEEGREEEARKEWEMPRRLLERWREKGVGGDDVESCLRDGDAVFGDEEESSEGESDSKDSAT